MDLLHQFEQAEAAADDGADRPLEEIPGRDELQQKLEELHPADVAYILESLPWKSD